MEREVLYKDALEDMVNQFAYRVVKNGVPSLSTGGLSALENAFDILGYKDPQPTPHLKCEIDGCNEHASCGTSTNDGYKRTCGKHFGELNL